jgi:DNA-binding NarL/FixJ family response regulator
MSDIPPHILAQIPVLRAKGLPPGRIAFMLHLSTRTVEGEIRKLEAAEKVNTTEKSQN